MTDTVVMTEVAEEVSIPQLVAPAIPEAKQLLYDDNYSSTALKRTKGSMDLLFSKLLNELHVTEGDIDAVNRLFVGVGFTKNKATRYSNNFLRIVRSEARRQRVIEQVITPTDAIAEAKAEEAEGVGLLTFQGNTLKRINILFDKVIKQLLAVAQLLPINMAIVMFIRKLEAATGTIADLDAVKAQLGR